MCSVCLYDVVSVHVIVCRCDCVNVVLWVVCEGRAGCVCRPCVRCESVVRCEGVVRSEGVVRVLCGVRVCVRSAYG